MTRTKFQVGQTVVWYTETSGSIKGKVAYISQVPVPFPVRVDFGKEIGLRYFRADGSRDDEHGVCLFAMPTDLQP